MTPKLKANVPIAALALLCIGLAFTAEYLQPITVVLWYAVIFLPYFWIYRAREDVDFKTLAAVAIVARVAVAFADPLLSFDISRYVWEGRVTAAGLNPFVVAPNSETLAFLRDATIYPTINHPELAAIYPPGAQFFFAAVAAVGGGWTAFRLAFVAVEILGAIAVWKLFQKQWSAEKFKRALIVYGLNPLIILEVAWSGHLDVLAWTPLIISLMWIATNPTSLRSTALAGLLFGVSIAAKFLAVVLIPYLFLRRPWGKEAFKHRVVYFATAALFVVAVYVPFSDAGGGLFGSFGKFAASWQNNEGYFRVFEKTALETLRYESSEKDPLYHFRQYNETALRIGFTKEWLGTEIANTTFSAKQLANFIAKLTSAMVMGFILLGCLLIIRDPVRGSFILLICLYCVAPTVHPWYVAWLVPFAVWETNRLAMVFSALVLFGYTSWVSLESGGAWAIPDWAILVEYGALTAFAFWDEKN